MKYQDFISGVFIGFSIAYILFNEGYIPTKKELEKNLNN